MIAVNMIFFLFCRMIYLSIYVSMYISRYYIDYTSKSYFISDALKIYVI